MHDVVCPLIKGLKQETTMSEKTSSDVKRSDDAATHKGTDDRNRDTNPDAITNSPGSHPVATGVGALAAGAAGAAIGSVVPGIGNIVGGVVGAIIGAVGGGAAGHAVGEAIDPSNTDDYWREHHQTREDRQSSSFEQFQPAYQYGASLADQTDRTGYDEDTIRADWEKHPNNQGLPYEDARTAIRDEYDRKLQLRQEQLRIEKERVSAGEVNVRKEVTTETQTVQVPVEREEVVITRTNPGSTVGDAGTIQENEEIRVPLSEERVNVSKETVVTGEVDISKRKVTDTQTVQGTVRKEDVKVEGDNARIDDRTSQG